MVHHLVHRLAGRHPYPGDDDESYLASRVAANDEDALTRAPTRRPVGIGDEGQAGRVLKVPGPSPSHDSSQSEGQSLVGQEERIGAQHPHLVDARGDLHGGRDCAAEVGRQARSLTFPMASP